MKLNVTNLYTYLEFEEGDKYLKDIILKRMHTVLGARQEGFQYSPAYKRGSWDGIVDFYDYSEDKFPTGLLPKVQELLGELQTRYNFQYDTTYNKTESFLAEEDIDDEVKLLDNKVGQITLRNYQYEAVYNSLVFQNGILHSATNCLTKDTPILTQEGYKTIEEMFKENDLPLDDYGKKYNIAYPLINRNGEVENTSILFNNGIQDVYKVTTFEGDELEATGNHPLLTIDNGNLVWKKVTELSENDVLVSRIGTEVYGKDTRVSDEFEAYCLGLLTADGSYYRRGELAFSNDEKILVDDIMRYFKDYIGGNAYYTFHETYYKVYLYNTKNIEKNYYNKLGINPTKSRDKRVHECIRNAPKNIQLAYLSGFMECETHISKTDKKITTKSSSKNLLSDLQRMLSNLGIPSNIRYRKNTSYGGKYSHLYFADLTIGSTGTKKFLESMTFKTEFRNKRKEYLLTCNKIIKIPHKLPYAKKVLKDFVKSSSKTHKELYGKTQLNMHSETIKSILKNDEDGDINLRKKVENIFNENLQFKKVESIEYIGKKATYDVHMPITHSFIANTIVNHNSGKTEMASGIIDQLLPQLERGERIAFFAGSKEIFHQSADRLKERLNIDVGKIGDGIFKPKQVSVVMIPTVNANLKDPSKGIKLTPKQNLSKKIAVEYLPKFEGGKNQKKLLKLMLSNFEPKTKVDANVKTILEGIYNTAKTDGEVLMHLRAHNAKYHEYIREKNTKKYDKYKRMREFLDSVAVMIVDEAHHSKSDSWYNSLMTCNNALYRIALTGSIDKKDELLWMRMQALFGEVLIRTSNDFLISEGHSAKPTIHMIPIANPKDMENIREYRDAYKEGITNNTFRNKVIAKLAEKWYNKDKGVLIIVNMIEHGENISELLEEQGVKHYFLKGEATSEERKKALNAMRSGKLKVLIATSLIDEGVDISGIHALILGAGGKSLRQTLQRIGRALRRKEGDNTCQVFDFTDMTHRFLLKHSQERRVIYDEEEFEVKDVMSNK